MVNQETPTKMYTFRYYLFVLLQEDFWGRASGWGCSFANISTGAHADPKLNKHNAKWYTCILIYIVGYQFHETVNSEIKKITIDNFQLIVVDKTAMKF